MLETRLPPAFASLIDLIDQALTDHAFRWFMARNLEGIDTTTTVPTFFGHSIETIPGAMEGFFPDLASDAESSFDIDQLGATALRHPAVLPIIEVILQQVLGWSGEDAEAVRETITEMRRVRNQALYVDWNGAGFSTPLASSEDSVQERLVRARAVVTTVEQALPLMHPE